MTALDYISDIRENIIDSPEYDDPADNLWSNAFLLSGLNRAQKEIARRTLCLQDSTTATICTFTAAAGWNALSDKILRVDDVVLGGVRLTLAKKEELKAYNSTYDTETGTPTHYIIDGNRIRFIPNLTASAACILTVKRLPLVNMTMASTPEIPEDYRPALGHYVGFLAFIKPDSQTINKSAAADNLEIFTGMVGPAISIKEQYSIKNNDNDSFNMQDTVNGAW